MPRMTSPALPTRSWNSPIVCAREPKTGNEMFVENDGLPVKEMLAGVCADLDPLVAVNRGYGEILRRFAKRLWHIDRQLTAAVDWAEHADQGVGIGRRDPIPVSPPSDVPLSAAEEQQLLRGQLEAIAGYNACLLYTSPSPRDRS